MGPGSSDNVVTNLTLAIVGVRAKQEKYAFQVPGSICS